MQVIFIHGACVRDGAWWWARVAELLRAEGIGSVAADLPSCGEPAGNGRAGLAADVAEVRRLLAGAGPSVVIGHSYGGVVATEAAAATGVAVRGLVYVTSFLPDVGESLADLAGLAGGSPPPYLDFAPDGTFGVRPELAPDTFLHDCDAEAVEGALARLTRQSAAVQTEPVRHAAWRQLPSTYLLCADDRGTPPAVQRAQAARATAVVELPTGHHPFLSHPGLVARAVLAACRGDR
ncbi:MAG TPA: alpha/beta hydrolase [Pilimelia sp.]|nr:alpha/beta hydrolase [Pilimelia sp.]